MTKAPEEIECPMCGKKAVRNDKLFETFQIFEVVYPVGVKYECPEGHMTAVLYNE